MEGGRGSLCSLGTGYQFGKLEGGHSCTTLGSEGPLCRWTGRSALAQVVLGDVDFTMFFKTWEA